MFSGKILEENFGILFELERVRNEFFKNICRCHCQNSERNEKYAKIIKVVYSGLKIECVLRNM